MSQVIGIVIIIVCFAIGGWLGITGIGGIVAFLGLIIGGKVAASD